MNFIRKIRIKSIKKKETDLKGLFKTGLMSKTLIQMKKFNPAFG